LQGIESSFYSESLNLPVRVFSFFYQTFCQTQIQIRLVAAASRQNIQILLFLVDLRLLQLEIFNPSLFGLWLFGLWLPQLQIERLAAAATRKKSQKSQEKLRVAAAATRNEKKDY